MCGDGVTVVVIAMVRLLDKEHCQAAFVSPGRGVSSNPGGVPAARKKLVHVQILSQKVEDSSPPSFELGTGFPFWFKGARLFHAKRDSAFIGSHNVEEWLKRVTEVQSAAVWMTRVLI